MIGIETKEVYFIRKKKNSAIVATPYIVESYYFYQNSRLDTQSARIIFSVPRRSFNVIRCL